MKKISNLIVGFMVFVTTNAFCQTSYLLTFSARDKNNSAIVALDNVYIKNQTAGGHITISDTFLYLILSSGISEKSWNANTFSLYSSNPPCKDARDHSGIT